ILDTSINHAHIETAPQFIDEENVLFVTNRDNELHYYNDLDTNQKQPHRNIYQLSKTDNKWVFNNEYDYPFKNKNNVGSFAMSEDKKRLYISVCEFNWKNKLVCSIFISYNENGKWSEPKKIEGDVNLTQYTSTQPALGIDTKTGEEVLYFVSDRPGGRGGLDIWYTVFDSKRARFKNAKNLGNKINTVGDEVTPFYRSSDRLLCFSSDGWPGNGGLDVFKTHGELKKWGEISHLPPGINSSYDDLNFTSSKHDNSGLFTSNRPGGVKLFNETCCDDLYEFTDIANVQIFLTGNIISLKDSSFYQFLAEKQLIDKDVLDEINDKLVYLFILDKNSEEEPILIGVDTIANNKYNFRLEPNTEYLLRIPDFDFSHSIITGLNSDTIFCTDTLKDFISDKPIVINNIYYEFDDYRLNDQSKSIIDTTIYELLDKFPYINIEILSHTDAKGDDDYNMTLSQKRAESVVKYLVSKGIKVERLNATGYGEDKPIAPNFNEDGSDNSEGRARNRRTEFRIIQKVNKKIIYSNE
ncbi:MAG: OmpA family protein, partial [Bacteroidales bacterium]|nr:OmpA family protein [Bacteroidales bacterium]